MIKSELCNYYKNKRVLVTGHTGFKGSWLTKILLMAGAEVIGYSTCKYEDTSEPRLFNLAGLESHIHHIKGDIRDFEKLNQIFDIFQPEIVLHLAAQPIVRTSYQEPKITYETNVMGTVNICEAVRKHPSVKSFLNVTTDKVYKNNEWCWGYRESELLDGYDPYSNSKSCSELVTHSYINSFFGQNRLDAPVAVSTARAGNVIGGGDFAKDRIVPDCVRAVGKDEPIIIRNPNSIRPYQHVLEPLFMYLTIAAEQEKDHAKAGFYNVGPDDCDCITTGELVKRFGKYWGKDFKYQIAPVDSNSPHEACFLKLDTSLVKGTFGWKPTWHIDEAIEKTVEFSRVYLSHAGSIQREELINIVMEDQINEFTKRS
jgi:CDP-glucose 4,6-dehydratase